MKVAVRVEPSARCCGCGRRFAPAERCWVGHYSLDVQIRGSHQRALTYCERCRAAGFPCDGFEEVAHP
ncbi:MAG: hypothetical protein ACHQ0J_05040 [Candidatus Dormibacterales bacterium]